MIIPYGKQDITDEDIAAVNSVLKSDFLTTGPAVPEFEKKISGYCSVKHAIACNSATSALHIACLALGLGKGDILWTVTNSFVASSNCALYCGASVDFLDIDIETFNLDLELLEIKLANAKKNNLLPKILVCVHFGGSPCDMEKIFKMSREYNFKIIEDSSHAIGALYSNDTKVGSCEYCDANIFSFHPVKIITTGEGGVITTNSQDLANKMSMLRTHGITRDNEMMHGESDGDWYYQQIYLGLNYRMTDIHAALGSSQMNRLNQYIDQRRALAHRYNDLLKDLPVSVQSMDIDRSSVHLYPILFENSSIRKKVFNFMRNKKIGVNVHYIPIHTQPYYKKLGFSEGDYPIAEDYYSRAISIPMYGSMDFDTQDKVVKVIEDAISSI